MGAFFKIQDSNFCHLRMGEDNLMKLLGNIALVSLCLNLKGYGCGVKIVPAMPNLVKLVIFHSRGRGRFSLQATPMS